MEKISVITGGSSGLGLAIARKLLTRGENVAIIGRNKEKLLNSKMELEKEYGCKVLSFAGDISNQKFVNELFSEINKTNMITCLYNCAGSGRFGIPENNNIEMINEAMSGSLIGLILVCSTAINYMKENGGVVVNVMSSAALKGNPTESVYCAAKWGARGFTEALKAYTKGSNIKVVGVYPGGMKTNFWNEQCGANPDTSKFMDADEVAEQIIFSSSNRKTLFVSDLTIERR